MRSRSLAIECPSLVEFSRVFCVYVCVSVAYWQNGLIKVRCTWGRLARSLSDFRFLILAFEVAAPVTGYRLLVMWPLAKP